MEGNLPFKGGPHFGRALSSKGANRKPTSIIPLYKVDRKNEDCTARQCSPLRRKFMECSINSPALLLLMKHLVFG